MSRETALEMAAGALARSRAGIALAVTGIAGPDGGSAEKPVGLVWFGLARDGQAGRRREAHVATIAAATSSAAQTVRHALEMGLRALDDDSGWSRRRAVDRVGPLLEGLGEHAEGAVEHRAHHRAEDAALELVVDEEVDVAAAARPARSASHCSR